MHITKLSVRKGWFGRIHFCEDIGFTKDDLGRIGNKDRICICMARVMLDRRTALNVYNLDFNQVTVLVKVAPRFHPTLVSKAKPFFIYARYQSSIDLKCLRKGFYGRGYQSNLDWLTEYLLSLPPAQTLLEGLSLEDYIKRRLNPVRKAKWEPSIWAYEYEEIILVFSGDNPKKLGPEKILESLKDFIPKALLTLSLLIILVVLPFFVVLHFTCLGI